jgi:hypothetical protein
LRSDHGQLDNFAGQFQPTAPPTVHYIRLPPSRTAQGKLHEQYWSPRAGIGRRERGEGYPDRNLRPRSRNEAIIDKIGGFAGDRA